MRRSALFSVLGTAALFLSAGFGQTLKREGQSWVQTYTGSMPAAARLRVNGHGPVTLMGGTSRTISYTVQVSVLARFEAEARRMLARYAVRVSSQGEWAVLTTPGGEAMSKVMLKAPRLSAVVISTASGGVEATGIDGTLDVDSGAGDFTVDRVRGDCSLVTGGGDIHVGEVGGLLHCTTGGGHISVKVVRNAAVLETNGGNIVAGEVRGPVQAATGAGEVHIGKAGGPVHATTGGGQIIVDQAAGIVTAINMAGSVQVGSAAGVRCESGSGPIHVSNISGSMRVSTSIGSIFASLMGSRLADSFLATGDGDITVIIPSNVGVTIRAVNQMADTIKRIVSDYPAIQARQRGTRLIAEGQVNGGGPLLQISGTGGTIFIKRQ